MSVTYKRLGSQGEIHISEDDKNTLCGILASHSNWTYSEERTDKDPLLCVDCLEARPKEEKTEAKTPAEKPAAKKVPKKTTKKATKKAKEE